MSAQRVCEKFRPVDLGLTVIVVAALLMLAACGAGPVREAARRGQCNGNIRQIALGLYGMGSSPIGYPQASTAFAQKAERRIGLPLVGSVTIDGKTYSAPGAADSTNGGYSFFVKILDSMEEVLLYEEIKATSEGYTKPAFDKKLMHAPGNGQTPLHFCRLSIPFLQCPSTAEGEYADVKQEIYKDDFGDPGISSYVCISGTHFRGKDELVENGVIVSRRECDEQGCRAFSQDDIGDGTAKTLMICETREPNYASWYDGQVNWVTAFSPQKSQHVVDFGSGDHADVDVVDGVPDVVQDGWFTAVNAGPSRAGDTENIFMNQHPFNKDQSYGGRRWGPSSRHRNGVVVHAFADSHTAIITEDVDPAVYYALVTRNANDFADIDAIVRE